MRLTERQKLILFSICLDTLRIESTCFGMNRADRSKLCDEIVNQQDKTLESDVVSIPCKDQEENEQIQSLMLQWKLHHNCGYLVCG